MRISGSLSTVRSSLSVRCRPTRQPHIFSSHSHPQDLSLFLPPSLPLGLPLGMLVLFISVKHAHMKIHTPKNPSVPTIVNPATIYKIIAFKLKQNEAESAHVEASAKGVHSLRSFGIIPSTTVKCIFPDGATWTQHRLRSLLQTTLSCRRAALF